MGVIGVVAALTIPNLNSSTNDKEKIAKVKKIYSNLQDAFGRAEAVYGPFDEWFVDDTKLQSSYSKRAGERITEFMKISKVCGLEKSKGCFTAGKYKLLDNSEDATIDDKTQYYKVITADGTSIVFEMYNTTNCEGDIMVDIDGPSKGGFVLGKDLFYFIIEDGVITLPYESTFAELIKDQLGEGWYASNWIINYDNMDYLKFDSSNKCPNGTTVTEQHPSCK